ncbi:hypothetical protein M5K25_017907 [Dendrobium thyrsiflorum]|uniref:Uncharacterized protein n=1 Tax=Dendrobium thyrsiflorum TaxID=117978 RepID=A0ABD0UNT4_DENTH
MEEVKKLAESTTPTMGAYLSEVRLESSPTAIGFSDACLCCGNKKRRCLQPASFSRKKLLVLDSSNPDSSTAGPLLTPSPPPFRYLCSDPIPPMSPPPPPLTPAIHPPPVAAAFPASELPEKTLERSNSTVTAASVEEKKEDFKDGEDAAVAEEDEEVRVSVRCRCGIVRKILLVR